MRAHGQVTLRVIMLPTLEGAPTRDAASWTLWKRVAFRFACAYSVLFLPQYLNGYADDVPGSPHVPLVARIAGVVVPWFGAHVLHLAQPIVATTNGSGDTTFDWVQALCVFTIAVGAAAVWSVVDRKRQSYDTLHAWLRVALRYSLAMAMLSYGIAKVLKMQFPAPTITRLLQPYGDSSPMGLLWTFMGYSTVYTVFCGLVEVVGGGLLLWQRTTPLGALLVTIGMTDVVLLNFSYDVPVKLYSVQLLLMATFLLLPDLLRLAGVLVLNRATAPAALRPPAARWQWHRAGVALKTFVVIAVCAAAAIPTVQEINTYGDLAPVPALYGLYEVTAFSQDGQPTAATAADRWQRFVWEHENGVAIHLTDGTIVRLAGKDDPGAKTMELNSGSWKDQLTYARPDADRLVVRGPYRGRRLDVEMRKIPLDRFLLVSRGFHWISERPFNR